MGGGVGAPVVVLGIVVDGAAGTVGGEATSKDGAVDAHAPTVVKTAAISVARTTPSYPDLLAAGTLPAAWARSWRAEPHRPVLMGAASLLSRGELDTRSAAVAGGFAAAGVRAGDRVLISASPSVDLVVAHVAALRLGAVVLPVNTAYRDRELDHIVGDAEPALVLRDDEIADLPAADPAAGLDAAAPDDLAMLLYTSGTTGRPKGAMLTHANVLAGAEAVRIAWRWTADDRLVLALPLFHMHGLGVGVHGTLLAGGSAVVLPRFDVDAVLDAIADHAATMFFGVPTMYARLAESPRLGELAGLRLCVSGSAPLPADLHRRIAEGSGQRVLERYGMTETLMNVSNPYEGERRPGSVGLPLPGVELRLGQDGEILVRGPNVFSGYWRNDTATAAAFDAGGWFRTGDVGELDDDGYLRIIGRTKELIISGGFNVYPREVEDVLREHPAVADVAVVGAPSEEWGEVVTAVVVTADGAATDADALVDFASGQLARFKVPRVVRFVDALPRNAMGKVLRDQLL